MDLVEAVRAKQETSAVVQPGEGAFDDPAFFSEPGAVFGLAARDDRFDSAAPDQPAVLVVVVAAVGKHTFRSSTRPAGTATDRRHAVEQLEQLHHVVAIGGGQLPGERQPAAVYEEMVLAARPAAVDRVWTGFRALFFACR